MQNGQLNLSKLNSAVLWGMGEGDVYLAAQFLFHCEKMLLINVFTELRS